MQGPLRGLDLPIAGEFSSSSKIDLVVLFADGVQQFRKRSHAQRTIFPGNHFPADTHGAAVALDFHVRLGHPVTQPAPGDLAFAIGGEARRCFNNDAEVLPPVGPRAVGGVSGVMPIAAVLDGQIPELALLEDLRTTAILSSLVLEDRLALGPLQQVFRLEQPGAHFRAAPLEEHPPLLLIFVVGDIHIPEPALLIDLPIRFRRQLALAEIELPGIVADDHAQGLWGGIGIKQVILVIMADNRGRADILANHCGLVLDPLDQIGAREMNDPARIGAHRVQMPHAIPERRERVTEILAVTRHDERIDGGVLHISGETLVLRCANRSMQHSGQRAAHSQRQKQGM